MKKGFLILVMVLIGCNSNDGHEYKNIDFSSVGHGQLHGNGAENIEPSNLIIENTPSWSDLIAKMNTVNKVSESFTETGIDFSEFLIISVFDEVYGNGGHSIDIVGIVENGDNIVVSVEKLLKGDASSVITQPYHIIKMPKTEKKIIFE